ncbi:nucleotidyltransferase family protein [Methanobrevibacter curvatus]|uniref:protein adenylyltransferase n=1 Tax=Methanobrevibacter curvatus TaxID=49547 RepID=A0A165ZTZ2_9EURY|nr:nucleotidyltransferase family protein [Methanobrevibacter curvatus]KZX11158.1 nucleotidyltransferase domain protein [Methanobrevibacter curvatus]
MKKLKTISEILQILKNNEKELKKKYGFKAIGIFGSYLNGNVRMDSDLDILVEFQKDANVGIIKYINIEENLTKLFGIEVDLVEKSALKPKIGKHILKEVVYP